MKLKTLSGLLLASMLSFSASASVLNFEDSTAYSLDWLPDNYGGFTWGSQGFVVLSDAGSFDSDYGYQTTFHNSYGSPSGKYAVSNAFGLKQRILFNEDIDFVGAYFTSWAAHDRYRVGSAESISLRGYRDGKLVGSVAASLSPKRYDWVQADLKNIDRLDIVTSKLPRWWLMDDFTFQKRSTAPAPLGLPLLMLGLISIGAARVRRQ